MMRIVFTTASLLSALRFFPVIALPARAADRHRRIDGIMHA